MITEQDLKNLNLEFVDSYSDFVDYRDEIRELTISLDTTNGKILILRDHAHIEYHGAPNTIEDLKRVLSNL